MYRHGKLVTSGYIQEPLTQQNWLPILEFKQL